MLLSTGTLTENRMTVVQGWLGGKKIEFPSGGGELPNLCVIFFTRATGASVCYMYCARCNETGWNGLSFLYFPCTRP